MTIEFGAPGYEVIRALDEQRPPDGLRSLGGQGSRGGPGPDRLLLCRRVADRCEVVVRRFSRPVSSQRDRLRFEQEISRIRALAHVPHLAPPLDAGILGDGRAFVVTIYCVAGSLHDHVLEVGRLTPIEVRRIGAKLAGALTTVHQRELVHRNIAPSNVLIDADGEPALADFGLVSLSMSQGDYMPDLVRERRQFLAPEAYLPELMTPASDIYALGATLHALLAGTTLLPDASHLSRMRAGPVDETELVDLPKVPPELMAILRQAMALDPRDRFPTATTLRDALVG